MLKTNLLLIIFLLSAATIYAAKYLLPNESRIYSFTTTTGKKMMLAEDDDNKYVVYRFGTKDKIELEYYSKATDSPKKFTYYGFFRPVTDGIYGVDENAIHFYIGNFNYTIFDNGYEENQEEGGGSNREAGMHVTDTATKKTTEINANLKTIKGSIHGMWYDERFKQR